MKPEALLFQEWATAQGYDMWQHPLHFLFLNEKTNAARQGWKAGHTAAIAASVVGSRPEELVDLMEAAELQFPLHAKVVPEWIGGECDDHDMPAYLFDAKGNILGEFYEHLERAQFFAATANAYALSPAPVVSEGAGQGWALVLDGLPEDDADPLYVLGRWEDGDVRRCQLYKGELSCGFPARGGYPVWWMSEPANPPALRQDGHCVACQYPRYILKGQHWGSCSNEECAAFKEDKASASYLLSVPPQPQPEAQN